jgi:hypothetical protein
MKPITKIDCKIDGVYYAKGEEIEVQDKQRLIELNERGFIEPMTMKEIQDYFKKPTKKTYNKKEEEK